MTSHGLVLGVAVFTAIASSAYAADCRHVASSTPTPTSQLAHPTDAPIVGHFGLRRHPILGSMQFHPGLDYQGTAGDPVRASASGKVLFAGPQGAYGLLIVIRHQPLEIETAYAHLSRLTVKAGDCVQQGEVIGQVGNTGHSSGVHLHFEIRKSIDPLELLGRRY